MSTPIEFTQTRWRCPHCRRSWSRRPVATRHAVDCPRDPDRRGCLTCVHLRPAEAPERDTGYAGHPPWCAEGHFTVGPYGDDQHRAVRDCPGWTAAAWAPASEGGTA